MKFSFLLLSLERSGGVRGTVEIANHMAKLGHSCRLVVVGYEEIPFYVNINIQIIRVKPQRKRSGIYNLISVYTLAKAIPKNSDIIAASYYLTAYAAIIAKIKGSKAKLFYIVRAYEPNFFRQADGHNQWMSYILAKMSYSLPLIKSTISVWLSDLLARKGYSNIPVINNGINSKLFCPDKLKSAKNEKIIMTIGNRRANRGYFDFCDSVNKLWETRKDFKILVIGSDKELLKYLNPPSEQIIPKNDDDLVNAYRSALLFTSCSHEEGFGRTPLESMSCGTAVVCTDSGGINDYAKNEENCLIIPAKNIEQISSAINTLLDDDSLRDKLIKNGRETAINFDWNVICQKYENHFS